MLRRLVLLPLAVIAGLVLAALAYGTHRWETATRRLNADLEAARRPVGAAARDTAALAALPAPVRRYVRVALGAGVARISTATLEQDGTMNLDDAGGRWVRFTSTQRVVARRPGFVWDARVTLAPGLTARVHDAYVAGRGRLRASLFGLVPLASARDTPELAEGELMRWLAEAAWYPTALLPGGGVRWDAEDDSTARATIEDGGRRVTLRFRFGADGLIESVRAGARGRRVGDRVVPTPWEGRWSRYQRRGGMLVPLEGEVAWILPEGRRPYWRGRITRVTYEWAE